MRRFILRSPNSRHSSIRRHDNNRSEFCFESSIEEGEAFDVEHVNFVDEEDSWNDFRFAFFSPIAYFRVDLIS